MKLSEWTTRGKMYPPPAQPKRQRTKYLCPLLLVNPANEENYR